MKNLQEATERICELKGNVVALDAACSALVQQLAPPAREQFGRGFARFAEMARTSMLNAAISEHSIAAFEIDARRIMALVESLERGGAQAGAPAPMPPVPHAPPVPPVPPIPPAPPPPGTRDRAAAETLLLAVPRVTTFQGQAVLTGATGFFFERDERLYLVTSRHVLIDEPSGHHPDRIEIVVHIDETDLSQSNVFSLLLYEKGKAAWRQAQDSGGEIDVAALRIDRKILGGFRPRAFSPRHLLQALDEVEIGTPLLVVGFPLGFHDTRHHLPVARQAVVASSFGTRFQGQGLFLTDARTHRGTSGAPVVTRSAANEQDAAGLPWKLLGIHSSRLDMGGRDLVEDESLGLNSAWYADILLTLTEEEGKAARAD